MKLAKQLITVAEIFAKANEISLETLSKQLLGRSPRLREIKKGGGLNTSNWDDCMEFFSKNWPAGVKWPAGVIRPKKG